MGYGETPERWPLNRIWLNSRQRSVAYQVERSMPRAIDDAALKAIAAEEVDDITLDPDRWGMRQVQNHRPYEMTCFTPHMARLLLDRLDFTKPDAPPDAEVEEANKREIREKAENLR